MTWASSEPAEKWEDRLAPFLIPELLTVGALAHLVIFLILRALS